jgi:hypothetical protein
MADDKLILPQKSRDFVERYANNVRFESSFWDLKILHGVIDQPTAQEMSYFVHTAMHLPWTQAKLVAFYLYMNVLFNEVQSGEIGIPEGLVPSPFEVPEPLKDDPRAQALFERVERLRQDLFGPKSARHGEETQEG